MTKQQKNNRAVSYEDVAGFGPDAQRQIIEQLAAQGVVIPFPGSRPVKPAKVAKVVEDMPVRPARIAQDRPKKVKPVKIVKAPKQASKPRLPLMWTVLPTLVAALWILIHIGG